MFVEETESELLKKAQRGDFNAFAELTEPYRRSACEFLNRLTGEDSSEDVFMTALLNAWKALDTFNGRSSYRTWLFSIARFAALDHLRKAKTRNEVSADDEESGANISAIGDKTTPPPSREIENEERSRIIDKCLQKLSEPHRAALVLYYYQDFQYSEIAELLGISIGTVMSRLHHAKAKLEKLLNPYKDDLL